MPVTAQFLKGIVAEARPIIERQMDDAKIIAGLRDVVSAQGGDWGALKALIKAHVEDDSDDASEGKRVKKIVDKADCTAAYADMLGLANMNENNFSLDRTYAEAKGRGNLPPHDPETGEVEEPFHPGPHSLAVHGGEPSIPSSPDVGAKNGGVARTSVDQGGDKPGFDICDGMQAATPISLSPPGPQRAAEQPGAILLPAPGTPFTNPRCLHADTCHFVASREACFDCLVAWSQRPKDEQVRLWSDAIEAAMPAQHEVAA
jgi:hypothetical protein